MIVGKLNVGKLLLFNVLVGIECVIVMDIVGMMWDVLYEKIILNGLFIILIDIVGLCEIGDIVEKEGICCVIKEIE